MVENAIIKRKILGENQNFVIMKNENVCFVGGKTVNNHFDKGDGIFQGV